MGVFRVTFPNINKRTGDQYWGFCDIPEVDDCERAYQLLDMDRPLMAHKLFCEKTDLKTGGRLYEIKRTVETVLTRRGIASVEPVPADSKFVQYEEEGDPETPESVSGPHSTGSSAET